MDGLECSEVLYSSAKENKDCRIDSQFFTAKIKHNGNLEYCPIGKYLISSQYGVSKDIKITTEQAGARNLSLMIR